MIKSMTGFSRAECTENGTKVTVEVHSVNGRFLDLKMKLPRYLNEFESELRNIAHKYIERGRVFLTINIDQPDAHINSLNVDFNLAGKYVQLAEEMASRYDIDNRIDARALLSMPDILRCERYKSDSEKNWEIAKNAVISAFGTLRTMREKEGVTIGIDVLKRLHIVKGYIEDIEKMLPGVVESNTSRLRKKIEKLIEVDKIDESRFAMEVAIYADRLDITEECVRFKSHCGLFEDEIEAKKTSGRKLSFLLQEMNREANTITSKSMDASISQLVVQIKEELEKMREQVENME